MAEGLPVALRVQAARPGDYGALGCRGDELDLEVVVDASFRDTE